MVGSLNKVMLIGNLGRDPEIRSTHDGKELASFSIATTETWKDKNSGEKKENTTWHRIVVFSSPLVNIVKNFLHKGSKVYIEGALQSRKWVDQSNVERTVIEIVLNSYSSVLILLDSRNNVHSREGGMMDDVHDNGFSSVAGADMDDEVPF